MKKILLLSLFLLQIANSFSQGGMWNIHGNAVSGGATTFLGTTNSADLVIKTNGQERAIIKGSTGGFRVVSLVGSSNGIVLCTPDGELYRNNLPNISNYVLNGNGNFVDPATLIDVHALSGWNTFSNLLILNNANANVGIGVNYPTHKLEVSGDVKIFGGLFANNAEFFANTKVHGSLYITDTLKIGDSSIVILPTQNEIYTDNKKLLINTHDYGMFHANNQNTIINGKDGINGGRVGIGTTTPMAKLTVRDYHDNNLCIGADWLNGDVGVLLNSHNDAGSAHMPMTFAASLFTFHGGAVQIGEVTSMPLAAINHGYNLYVKNGILTEKVRVAVDGSDDWADYVFADGYELVSLDSVENYVGVNNHLQGIPSSGEMVTNGNDLGLTDKLLLEKIENLYLYVIQLNKEIKLLKAQNELLIQQKDERK